MAKSVPEGKKNRLKRPKHLSLVDIAYQALVEAIVDQVFEPGSQINIDMMARDLNMSNTPVREALMRIASERFVEQKTNKGFIVTDFLSPEELHNMFTIRLLLETHALGMGEITTDAIEELERLATQMGGTSNGLVYQDFKDFLQADHQFHHTIVTLSRNEFLIQSWESLNVHLHLSRLYTGIGLFDRESSIPEHTAIVEALQKNDREQAIDHLSEHIRDTETRLIAFRNTLDNPKP